MILKIDLQDKLVDLLGFSDLDFITELMANKDEIVQTITTEVKVKGKLIIGVKSKRISKCWIKCFY